MGLDGALAAEERRGELLSRLRQDGRVDILEIADRLDVNPLTIRRDLKGLEREGAVRLVRGGAVYVGAEEFEVRQARSFSAKGRIAEKVAALLRDHPSVGFDASTTVYRVVGDLPPMDGLLAVTYGIPTFQALQGKPGVRPFLTGGELDARTGALVGPLAQRTLGGFRLSCCVLSTHALDPATGTMEPTTELVEMKEALAAAARDVVLAVDSTKLGRHSSVRSLGLDRIDVMVTELDPSDPRLDLYRDSVTLL